eukprot:CAMPEP_0194740844 /NCGR_PEP_ID=MMETSP0296-20130528/93944_1 /TAXON_ID=39354 /ORGANISM="Heterosigma akashiwo, Strain CCMP2393" /LENGTH=92 /DNA_ID=CAMNT_0039652125 /DNA_START=41 /DNA_END=319 /DNA_ORIENTATION=-
MPISIRLKCSVPPTHKASVRAARYKPRHLVQDYVRVQQLYKETLVLRCQRVMLAVMRVRVWRGHRQEVVQGMQAVVQRVLILHHSHDVDLGD